MSQEVSAGIVIQIDATYQPEQSHPLENLYMFSYRIQIKNENPFAVKLLRRHWHIKDSNGSCREMQGNGVVGGHQPLIPAGDHYTFVSHTRMRTGIGKMYGTFLMENPQEQSTFSVSLPDLDMIVPLKMN